MKDDFSKYEAMKVAGFSADQVFLQAVNDKLDPIVRIRLIRAVFSLNPAQAKEVIVRAQGQANSLDQYQEAIAKKLTPNQPLL